MPVKFCVKKQKNLCSSASGGDQEQAAGSLHLPEDEGRQKDPEGQGHQASPRYFPVRIRIRIIFVTWIRIRVRIRIRVKS
jgi:hypothetical protein